MRNPIGGHERVATDIKGISLALERRESGRDIFLSAGLAQG